MSTDYHIDCPKCRERSGLQWAEAKKKAIDAYGKVSPEDYLILLNKSIDPPPIKKTLNIRYYTDITSSYEFIIAYSCSCHVCGFTVNYRNGFDLHKKPKMPEFDFTDGKFDD